MLFLLPIGIELLEKCEEVVGLLLVLQTGIDHLRTRYFRFQALHTPNTFSPAAASWALTSPAPAIFKNAIKTNPRILYSCLVGPFQDWKLLWCRESGRSDRADYRHTGISQAPYTIKVPAESVTRACTPGRVATMSPIPDDGIRLNAVESASASVAVGAMTLTVR